jgi:hypothetical protein
MVSRISIFLRRTLSKKKFIRIKGIYLGLLSIPFGNNLNRLAQIYKSDKWGKHKYTLHYSTHFRKLKFKRLKLFEIGVGGYHFHDIGGNSLRMWKRYFPFAKIYSLDIYDKSHFEESRIRIFKGSQTDLALLDKIILDIGEPDIIIDDGSHINEHVITTFKFLFPKLKNNGIYVIEDTETSYWPDYGGDSIDINNQTTIMNFFKGLTDCLNYQELINRNQSPSYFDKNIISIQFYHNQIFIFKGSNDEASNVDPDNPESVLADKIYI